MQEASVSRSATTSRAVQFVESFGGPEVLSLREVPVPHAGSGRSCARRRRPLTRCARCRALYVTVVVDRLNAVTRDATARSDCRRH